MELELEFALTPSGLRRILTLIEEHELLVQHYDDTHPNATPADIEHMLGVVQEEREEVLRDITHAFLIRSGLSDDQAEEFLDLVLDDYELELTGDAGGPNGIHLIPRGSHDHLSVAAPEE